MLIKIIRALGERGKYLLGMLISNYILRKHFREREGIEHIFKFNFKYVHIGIRFLKCCYGIATKNLKRSILRSL